LQAHGVNEVVAYRQLGTGRSEHELDAALRELDNTVL
jgi:hypothetical protein